MAVVFKILSRILLLLDACKSGMDKVYVLLEVRESKRAVVLRTEGRQEAIRKAAKSVDPLIHVVFADDFTDVPMASSSVPHILQMYSFEWDEFLDVTDVDMILDRDRLRVIPRSPPVAQTLTHNRPASATVSSCSSNTSVSVHTLISAALADLHIANVHFRV